MHMHGTRCRKRWNNARRNAQHTRSQATKVCIYNVRRLDERDVAGTTKRNGSGRNAKGERTTQQHNNKKHKPKIQSETQEMDDSSVVRKQSVARF